MKPLKGRKLLPGIPAQEAIHATLEPHCTDGDSGAPFNTCQVLRGWAGIVQDLHAQLVIDNPDYRIFQVKTENGRLCFFAGPFTDRGNALITQAEVLSQTTCEHCGRLGKTRTKDDDTLTLCAGCFLAERYNTLIWGTVAARRSAKRRRQYSKLHNATN